MTGPCTIIFGLFFIALRLTCCCVQSVKGTKIAELIEVRLEKNTLLSSFRSLNGSGPGEDSESLKHGP